MVGTVTPTIAGSSARMPAVNASPWGCMPAAPSPPASRLRSPSHRLTCRCVPLPVSAATWGANETTSPCRLATARAVWRTTIAASAAATGSRGPIDISNWPSAYSGCSCCRSRPCASIVVSRSSANSWLRTRAMSLYPGPSCAGSNPPSSRRIPTENSNSNAARTDSPRLRYASAMRRANARGHAANGCPSCWNWSTGAHAHPGSAASGTVADASARSRRSPLGPSM